MLTWLSELFGNGLISCRFASAFSIDYNLPAKIFFTLFSLSLGSKIIRCVGSIYSQKETKWSKKRERSHFNLFLSRKNKRHETRDERTVICYFNPMFIKDKSIVKWSLGVAAFQFMIWRTLCSKLIHEKWKMFSWLADWLNQWIWDGPSVDVLLLTYTQFLEIEERGAGHPKATLVLLGSTGGAFRVATSYVRWIPPVTHIRATLLVSETTSPW